ncbi:MAG: hypothetical protein ACFFG0_08080 [Candidatus Thorarchaeota archaeon]
MELFNIQCEFNGKDGLFHFNAGNINKLVSISHLGSGLLDLIIICLDDFSRSTIRYLKDKIYINDICEKYDNNKISKDAIESSLIKLIREGDDFERYFSLYRLGKIDKKKNIKIIKELSISDKNRDIRKLSRYILNEFIKENIKDIIKREK